MFPIRMLRVAIFLSFSAETKGELHIMNTEHTTELQCQRSPSGSRKTVWYQQGENYSFQFQKKEENGSKLQVWNSGIFACCSPVENCPSNTDLAIVNFCTNDIFIMAHGKDAKKQEDNDRRHFHLDVTEELKKEENSNITLYCEFKTARQLFIVYWVRTTHQSECLYSLGAESDHLYFNEHCCVDSAEKRIVNRSTLNLSANCQQHDIEITNATSADSGNYFCVVGLQQSNSYNWSIIRNISLEIKEKIQNEGNIYSLEHYWPLYVGLLAIAILAITSGLVIGSKCLARTETKEGTVRGDFSNSSGLDALDKEECSPYAIGIRSFHDHDPDIFYSSLEAACVPEAVLAEGAAATARKSGSAICTVYSEVQMKRNDL